MAGNMSRSGRWMLIILKGVDNSEKSFGEHESDREEFE